MLCTALGALVTALTCALLPAGEEGAYREDFDSLADWVPLNFPKIPRHSRYTIVGSNGGHALRAVATNSASAIVCRRPFDFRQTPRLRWRWQVEGVLRDGDVSRKSGDDVPLRIYVFFDYQPGQSVSARERWSYELARRLRGEYPPDSALNYIWANRTWELRVFPSVYTKRSMLVVADAGARHVGTWREHDVDVLADYRAAFGRAPLGTGRIAIMSDTDNTHSRAVAHVDFLEVRGP